MKRGMIFLLLLIFITGCLPPQAEPGITDQEKISTFVAATRTAAVWIEDPGPQTDGTITPEAGAVPATQSPATETATSTLTSTPTQVPTPTLYGEDPILSLGIPSFKDNFASGDNFYLYNESQSSYQVSGNRMVLIAKKANNYETWSLAWEVLKNFYLEISGEFGPECSGKDRYGMIFRAPDTTEGYLLTITCDGSYRLSTWDSDVEEYTIIKNWTSSVHINTGPGGANRLGIKTKDSKLTGYINGFQVFELNDATFSKGRIGVVVAATNTPGFTSYLTQAVYWKLP
jgi:hypothetical protein